MQTDRKIGIVYVLSLAWILIIFTVPLWAAEVGQKRVSEKIKCRNIVARIVDGSINQIVLPPHSERYALGLLVRTKKLQRFLVVGSYLSTHELLSRRLEMAAGEIRAFLWGGEILLSNGSDHDELRKISAINDTCGYIARLRQLSKDRKYIRPGVEIKNSNHQMNHILKYVCPSLKAGDKPLELRSWNGDNSAHLNPQLNGVNKNQRHSIINFLFAAQLPLLEKRLRAPLDEATLSGIQGINLGVDLLYQEHPEFGDFRWILELHQKIVDGEIIPEAQLEKLRVAYNSLRVILQKIENSALILDVN